MGTEYPSSNGAGFYPKVYDCSGASQQHEARYYQQMQTSSTQPCPPFLPVGVCYSCPIHGYVYPPPTVDQQHFLSQQEQFHYPCLQQLRQTRPPSEAQKESQRCSMEGRYDRPPSADAKMEDAFAENAQIEEVQPQQISGKGTAKPLENDGVSETATTHHGIDRGSSGNSRVPLQGVDSYSIKTSLHVSESPAKERSSERSSILPRSVGNLASKLGFGSSQNSDEQHNLLNTEKVQSKDTHYGKWKTEKAELMKAKSEMETIIHGLSQELEEAREAKSQLGVQLRDTTTEYNTALKNRDSQVSSLNAMITQYKSKATEYETRMAEYKATNDNLTEQLSRLELSNSKQVGGTGAHKDSHAIPPNLVKSRNVVSQAALASTKAFIIFLKERNAYESHVAVLSLPKPGQDERSRKYAVQAYICSRLFAGFENDCFMDNLDCERSSSYLPANYEGTEFYLQFQNLEVRHRRYLADYEGVQKLGLQGIMDILKNPEKNVSRHQFVQFCCRKLVSIMNDVDTFAKEFPPSGDYSQHFLLQQLATNSVYCDKFLKPFVNLAMAAFLLHRLAFQFHPPARIFRYASGTPFDETYMEPAAPLDEDDINEEFVVGVMLIPGFQVGATVIKCIVNRVPRSTVTTRGPF